MKNICVSPPIAEMRESCKNFNEARESEEILCVDYM